MGKSKKRKRSSRSSDRSRDRSKESRTRSPEDVERRLRVIEETLLYLARNAENKGSREEKADSSPKIHGRPSPANSGNLNKDGKASIGK